jgi:predicted nuclease with TOPRIM domain
MSCLFLSTIRLHSIRNEKSKINEKLNDLHEQLMDLQNYSATISTGSITMSDVANAPASVFSRLMNFMSYSTANASQGAQSKFSIFQASTPLPAFSDATQQQNYMNAVMQSFYKQEMDNCIKVETKLLNAKETKIQQEISRLQTRLSMLETEENSAKSAQQQSAQNTGVNYAA